MKIHIDIDYTMNMGNESIPKDLVYTATFNKSRFLEKLPENPNDEMRYTMVTLLIAYLQIADQFFEGEDVSKMMSAQISAQTVMALYWPKAISDLEEKVKEQQTAEWAYNLLEGLDPEKLPRA